MRTLDVLRGAYARSPHWVRSAAGPFLAAVPSRLRHGGTYSSVRADIVRSQKDADFVAAYQLAQLRALVRRCGAASAYYRDVFRTTMGRPDPDPEQFTLADLARMPVITREVLTDEADRLLVEDRTRMDLVLTSGSTGRPARFYLDRDRSAKEIAFIHHIWARGGFHSNDRRAMLRGVLIHDVDRKPWSYDPGLRELALSPFHLVPEVMDEYLRLMARFKISFIHGYPSAIGILARHARLRSWKPPKSLKGILPISETLFSHQRRLFRSTFGDVAVLPYYGLSEKVAFAGEVSGEPDIYEFEPLYGYTELVNDDGVPVSRPGELGRIVSTGFLSRGMPLIRYDTGDKGSLVRPATPENRYRLRVARIRSRWGHEFLVARTGALVSITCLNIHSERFLAVRSYQFYQERQGEATVRVVPATLRENEVKEFVEELQERVGTGVRFRLEICDEIKLNSRGKRPLIEQKLDLLPFLRSAGPAVGEPA